MEPTKSPGALLRELGESLLQAGRYQEAEAELTKALEESGPEQLLPEIYLVLGKTQKALEKIPEALKSFSQAQSVFFEMIKKEVLELVNGLMAKEKFSEAENCLRVLMELHPPDAEIQTALGDALLGKDRYSESLAAYHESLTLEKTALAYGKLGLAHYRMGKYQDAARAYSQALELDSDDIGAIFGAGKAWGKLGDLPKSASFFEKALELAPDTLYPHLELAKVFQFQEEKAPAAAQHLTAAARLYIGDYNYQEAERLARQAAALDHLSGPAFLQLGRALAAMQGRSEEALEALHTSAELEKNAEVFYEIALCYEEQKEYAQALEAINNALQLSPKEAIYLVLKGRIFRLLGQEAEALTTLNDASNLDPEHLWGENERGLTLAALGRFNEAINSFHHALKLNPNYDKTHENLGDLLVKECYYQTALEVVNQGLEVRPTFFKYYLKGRALFGLGQYPEATESFNQALNLYPEDTDSLRHRGMALIASGQIEEGLGDIQSSIDQDVGSGRGEHVAEFFSGILEKDPENPLALWGRGLTRRKLSQLEASEQDFKEAVAHNPRLSLLHQELAVTQESMGKNLEAAESYTSAARSFLEEHKYKEAEGWSQKAIEMNSANWEAHYLLGQSLSLQSRFEEALKALDRADRLEHHVEIYQEMAVTYFDQNKFAEALQAMEAALSLEPGNPTALALKGVILRRMERLEDALSALNDSLSLNPQQPAAEREKGIILFYLKRDVEAQQAFERAIALDENDVQSHEYMGWLLHLNNQNEAALEALNKALKLNPNNSVTYQRIGRAYYSLDNYPEAISAFEQALRLDPEDAEAVRYKGSALRLLGNYEEALSTLQLAIDLDAAKGRPESPWLYAELGENLRLMNRLMEAKRALAKATSLDPNFAWAWAKLGATHESLNNYKSALEAQEQAIALQPDYAWAWGSKGVVLRLVKRYPEALQAFNKSLEYDPRIWIYKEKAITLRFMGDNYLEEAVETIHEAIKLDPNDGFNFGQKGYCLYLAGEYQEALPALDQALDKNPQLLWVHVGRALTLEKLGRDIEAQQAQIRALFDLNEGSSYLTRGKEYADLRAYPQAAQDFNQAIKLNPELAEAYHALAKLSLEHLEGRLEEATELANEALQLAIQREDTNLEGKICDTLGLIYLKRKMKKEALDHLERAFELLPEDLEIEDHLKGYQKYAQ